MKDLSLHILDIAQNSIRAGASNISISITESGHAGTLVIEVTDDGSGMPQEVLERVTDPFYTSRTTRKVGLGIPLFKQNAEATGGSLQIRSEQGRGTSLTATFGLDHIDRPPLGDVAGVMVMLAGANPEIRFIYRHRVEENEFVLDTADIAEALDGLPVNDPQVMRFLKEMINENLEALRAPKS
ncbi:MAG: ATP-binding protein [Bacteroides sp.]|jgi:anti-sigma regulatory factor (Ser/Thr protein kinase)|nr:ATP-binding protein [Bacteroides sp.]